ncbi:hypothetical protein Desdi_2243 [Desulfitobacterium dichloroeliminans LMG P-21439]|uniref:Uncharacterized protein n=1 Tax=Desulfitobacterium dichloroeliminans (strain LMG P-21439 / DCA1) TaxID=871963 RepID=L0F767_DESDL|nr:hypothetical protein [Desulfitobacterium dichloroeliminans]AGA69674.1 hypothetical protein Desdi_2243 [Desulfitobacterium dichloroeliminans LMG P-21439]
MFSQMMLPGLLLAIGFAGLIWWILEHFTSLNPSKIDGMAVVGGLAVSFIISLSMRGLLGQPIQVFSAIFILAFSYLFVQWQQKRKIPRDQP